jgi:uncharacterized protein (DUF2235 family)
MLQKRLVICGDGTWNEPEPTEDGMPSFTNVVKTAAAILPEDQKAVVQVVYYHKGVGERGGLWDHLAGGAFGVGISRNIEDVYLFIANNYQPGDELLFFGFSRGAYTVRSVAGLLRNSGILKREHLTNTRPPTTSIATGPTPASRVPSGRSSSGGPTVGLISGYGSLECGTR